MKTPTTTEELEAAGYKCVRTSAALGYVSRKNSTQIIAPYKGRYGTGYTVKTCRMDTTSYCWIHYYVK